MAEDCSNSHYKDGVAKDSSGPLDVSIVNKQDHLCYYIRGPKPEEQAPAGSGGSWSVIDATSSAQSSSTPGVSDDKYRNYAVVAGLVTGVGALGWYLLSKDKKAEEVQD